MEAICDPDRVGCALACALSVPTSTIADDHLDTGVLAEPDGEHLGRPIVQQVDRPVPLQIDQQRAVPTSSALAA
jgi:hypothetical protein